MSADHQTAYGVMPTIRRARWLRSNALAAGTAIWLAGVIAASVATAPGAEAFAYGNYMLNIDGRFDFHTWIWMISPCDNGCLLISAHAQPAAKVYAFGGRAELAGGRYTLTVDDPDGLRCDNVYYGPTIPTHDIYSWDAATLGGSVQSTFDSGCDGGPAGVLVYPFTLSRM